MQYKIREANVIMSKDGNEAMGKKMVLKSDDQQNEEPRVTVWYSDFPQAKDLGVGDTISGDMEKKDSGTPIPGRSGNYVNRTLKPEGTASAQSSGNLEARVKRLEDKVFGATGGQNKPDTVNIDEDIDPESVPF